MARINIEECWWSDPRRERLGQLLGNPLLAESVAVRAWRCAQEHWVEGELIPGYKFITLVGAYEFLKANLAELHEDRHHKSSIIRTPIEHISNTSEQTSNTLRTHLSIIEHAWIYVRGSEKYLSWALLERQKRVAAGRKSAEKRRVLYGSAQPKSNTLRTPSRTLSNTLEHSGSGSGSVSGSDSGSNSRTDSKKKEEYIYRQAIEKVYEDYPQRKGNQHKGKGIDSLARQITNQSDMDMLQKAVTNYARHCRDTNKIGTEYVSQFKTFASGLWKEWIDPAPIQNVSQIHSKTQQRLDVFNSWHAKYEQQGGDTNGET